MHLVHWFMILCLTIFLHNAEGDKALRQGVYYVIVHNLTQKVVQSDGSLADSYLEEKWKKWSVFANPHPYYYIKSGLHGYPNLFPYEDGGTGFHMSSLVLGSQIECKPSRGDKVGYKPNNPSQQWKIARGVNPIYNKCQPPLQLTVRNNLLYLEKPETVNGDPNSLFQVVTSEHYLDTD